VAELKTVQRQILAGLMKFEEAYKDRGCVRFADAAYRHIISAIKKNAIAQKQIDLSSVGLLHLAQI
jgi:hypothetical protein